VERRTGRMNKKDNSFQALIQKFFLQRMMKQKNASPETIKSYRDTFRLYIQYLNNVHGILPHKIEMIQMEAEYILGFLDNLDKNRSNHPRTINNRLAAIHAFLHFLSFEKPDYSSMIQRSLMIPFRKEEKRQMDFLTKEEIDALLNACHTEQELGRRDKLMILLLYNTGVRVSELIALRRRDVIFDTSNSSAYIHITGKGRKERNVPLWKNTARYVQKYMDGHGIKEEEKLFINYSGEELTRSGVRYRIQCLVDEVKDTIPSLNGKKVTPHTFRHSTALHLLQSGVDISTIAIWLGHESIMTTHKYMEADMEMKRKILEKIAEPSTEGYFYKPNADILSFLASL
jgi:integrase/recombinase XerD